MATSHKRTLENDYDSLVQKRFPLLHMEKVKFLTHCTSPEKIKSIRETNTLRKHPTPDIWGEPLAKDNAPHGVWFGVSLKNGKLPSISPFGTQRLLKSVTHLEQDWDSCNLVLYLEAIKLKRGNKTTVRLILLKGNDEETIAWCEEERLHKLDIHYNPFLTINIMNNQWICKTLKNEPEMERDIWVALFIADNVDTAGCELDEVELYNYCSNCHQYGHYKPKCPRAVCKTCGGYGHWDRRCPKTVCFNCGGLGHWAADCSH